MSLTVRLLSDSMVVYKNVAVTKDETMTVYPDEKKITKQTDK